jgi:hypothetical protein
MYFCDYQFIHLLLSNDFYEEPCDLVIAVGVVKLDIEFWFNHCSHLALLYDAACPKRISFLSAMRYTDGKRDRDESSLPLGFRVHPNKRAEVLRHTETRQNNL